MIIRVGASLWKVRRVDGELRVWQQARGFWTPVLHWPGAVEVEIRKLGI
jgi:hypothetical protein